jgi:uncharacterized protein YcbX
VIHVRGLLTTAIKGLRVSPRDELMLGSDGVIENRRFYLVDERGRMVNGKQIGELSALRSEYHDPERTLIVTLPDGAQISDTVRLGAEIDARFFRSELRAPLVLGAFSEAISSYVGRPLRLVEADPERKGVDRGHRGTVSLVSRGSLDRLAAVAGNAGHIDPRRFRMLVEIDGVDPHAEDAWVGRHVRVGEALVGFNGHVGRCLVTNRDPESGLIDFPTLDLLREYRADESTTEPLPFGIYGQVIEPGAVRVGDPVLTESP